MKLYHGIRLGRPEDSSLVEVTVVGLYGKPLKHRIYRGYLGSGPADLAWSILWDHLGKEPPRSLYMDFKEQFVSRWEKEWTITSEEIRNWINKRGD